MARSFLAVVAVALGLAFVFPAYAVVPPIKQPTWTELGLEQKQILAPLSVEWDKLEPWRRKKWIGIAKRYPAMNPEEQARIQRRMIDWIKLSPDDRQKVREKYKNLQKAPPEHKEVLKQKWQEYKQLPEEERQRLKADAAKAKPLPKPGKIVRTPVVPPAAIPAVAPSFDVTSPSPAPQIAPTAQP